MCIIIKTVHSDNLGLRKKSSVSKGKSVCRTGNASRLLLFVALAALSRLEVSEGAALPVSLNKKHQRLFFWGYDSGGIPAERSGDSDNSCSSESNLKGSKFGKWAWFPRGGAAASSASASASASSASCTSAAIEMAGLRAWKSWMLDARSSVSKAIVEFWSTADRTKFLLAGAVAGIVSRTAVSPLEVVATAQMVRGGNAGMMGELSTLFKNEGMMGFFKGNGANCLKVAPTRGVQFFAFESFKTRLIEWKKQNKRKQQILYGNTDSNHMDDDIELTPFERLIAGGLAGMMASSIVYPLEVVKTMLTMYPGKYPGIQAAFKGVLLETGPRGFYAGLAPTLVAMFPYVGVEFMIYETSKIAIEKFINVKNDEASNGNDKVSLPIIISLGLGAMAGAAAQTSAHPLDVIRKRLQIQGINGNPVLYKSTLDCAAGIAKKEGFSTLYKGLRPACVATIPGTGIAYITYEIMKQILGLSSA
eukprot:CAMPEP_0184861920 /NCGR_PEP_ID=MMETSP0580-20130426/6501_1 /TAXON_ID=1118495 /ORGANISM="Dactyliosolen fragilissimus" /LENGTH=475 /DNA_ID=CAMNT_0027359601 /DNA_START=82 /DNA_END=1509 /DNA_ORIENTATION=-